MKSIYRFFIHKFILNYIHAILKIKFFCAAFEGSKV